MSNRDVVQVYADEIPKWKVRKVWYMHNQGIREKDIAVSLHLSLKQVYEILRNKQ